jgi:hypothetical protein
LLSIVTSEITVLPGRRQHYGPLNRNSPLALAACHLRHRDQRPRAVEMIANDLAGVGCA